MIPYVRQSKIYDYIKIRTIVYLDELVEFTKVSMPTVRRDLKVLQDEGKIILLNGGGVKVSEVVDHSVVGRLEVNAEEKFIICAKAAQYVEPNDFIYLGPGTTENYLISFLAGKNVTVVTNGIFHVNKLIEHSIKTILIGGQMDNNLGITYGAEVYDKINKMNFTSCFIGASGVSEKCVSSFDNYTAVINEKVMERSAKKILMVDSTKINNVSHYVFGEIKDFDHIITTDKAVIHFTNIENFVIADKFDI
ncbi:transcriptional regulator of sugar metabolism [Sphaerochaeta pleomorpha str. Grapes]|uniref:Transcriptional regulator of sugar metabolism n=1 Tax=Sphaerochaeta pleomorpha (strain ATCC BAA-1885 / DSM 22778 / Grapes) TaxID=158190 RepID=G8QUU1_SPHPG|nr:DeoR/GlpR family DNA-binding transcription regulator [Sphaerochaeta pleomorpha]AEV28117.1 transcriptional regulator of sugar metabolism [Sphaerochaeta pleomorpha str. Grapes]